MLRAAWVARVVGWWHPPHSWPGVVLPCQKGQASAPPHVLGFPQPAARLACPLPCSTPSAQPPAAQRRQPVLCLAVVRQLADRGHPTRGQYPKRKAHTLQSTQRPNWFPCMLTLGTSWGPSDLSSCKVPHGPSPSNLGSSALTGTNLSWSQSLSTPGWQAAAPPCDDVWQLASDIPWFVVADDRHVMPDDFAVSPAMPLNWRGRGPASEQAPE